MENEPLNRERVFARLEELGIEVVRVPYHGGNDESFVEDARLYARGPGGAQEAPLYVLGEEPAYGLPVGSALGEGGERLEAEDEDSLREALEEPIYEKLGDAFGDSVDGVGGECVWKVAERRVVIEHGYLDWHSEELEA